MNANFYGFKFRDTSFRGFVWADTLNDDRLAALGLDLDSFQGDSLEVEGDFDVAWVDGYPQIYNIEMFVIYGNDSIGLTLTTLEKQLVIDEIYRTADETSWYEAAIN